MHKTRSVVAGFAWPSLRDTNTTHTAGVRVIAIPNRRYRPPVDALVLAGVVLGSVSELTPETVAAV